MIVYMRLADAGDAAELSLAQPAVEDRLDAVVRRWVSRRGAARIRPIRSQAISTSDSTGEDRKILAPPAAASWRRLPELPLPQRTQTQGRLIQPARPCRATWPGPGRGRIRTTGHAVIVTGTGRPCCTSRTARSPSGWHRSTVVVRGAPMLEHVSPTEPPASRTVPGQRAALHVGPRGLLVGADRVDTAEDLLSGRLLHAGPFDDLPARQVPRVPPHAGQSSRSVARATMGTSTHGPQCGSWLMTGR